MIDAAPLWLVGIALFAAMGLAYEGGLRLHLLLRSRADAPRNESSDESNILSGVLGLLALLMAFAFSLSLDRYEERRALVVSEANAIDTLDTRLALLPETDRTALASDLARYARARVVFGRASNPARSARAMVRAEALHDQLGNRLYAVIAAGPMDARTTLLAQAFDEVGDIAVARRAARAARLPPPVLALLALYCIVGAAMLGYSVAGSKTKHWLAAGMFFMLLSVAFVTILDLDLPRGGAITVSQIELERVAKALATRL